MITTEAQAKRKWCPLVRVRGASGSFNTSRDTIRDEVDDWIKKLLLPKWYLDFKKRCYRCKASGCMSWRWVDATHGFCGEFGAPDAGAGLPVHAFPASPHRPAKSGSGDWFLLLLAAVGSGLVVFFLRQF